MYKIGVIGAGNRVTPLVKMLGEYNGFEISCICDTDINGVKERYKDIEGIKYYTDAEEMLKSEALSGVVIGTRCSSHTEFALLAAKYNIPMFLEKPVCTTEEDLHRLEEIDFMNSKTVVSFPLRRCAVANCVKEIIDSGRLGRIEHVQAYNNVPYARGYYHKWYRDENETGGLFLQKSTHDFDYINYLLGDIRPVEICAVKSKQIFKGDMPAGLKCADCHKKDECPESSKNVSGYGDPYIIGEYCCFATDTGNEDSGSAIVLYESGMHVVYSQNFFVRKGAGKRGARLMGYYGTVEFDFNTGIVNVFYHNENRTETYNIDVSGNHSGGDGVLVKNFADVVSGKDISRSDLRSGILSAKMCLMAKKSSEDHKFYRI